MSITQEGFFTASALVWDTLVILECAYLGFIRETIMNQLLIVGPHRGVLDRMCQTVSRMRYTLIRCDGPRNFCACPVYGAKASV